MKSKVTTDTELYERALLKAIRALDFYAKAETYFAIAMLADPPCGDFKDDFGPVPLWDGSLGTKPGKKAREALFEIYQLLDIEEVFGD